MKRDLGYEEMGKEVHTYAPAFSETEFDEILSYSDHIVFNSFQQYNQFKEKIKSQSKANRMSDFGLILSTLKLKSICTILVFHIQDLGLRLRTLKRTSLKESMDYISIRCANKILIRWSVPCKLSMKNLGNILKR